MNKPKISFYPVGNGSMTLIEIFTDPKRVILFDMNIKDAADDDSDTETFDVAGDLRKRLPKDLEGRPYVDLFIHSHADDDHILGVRKHFHLGKVSDWQKPEENEDPMILIHEIWTSSWYRKIYSKENNTLDEDAKALHKEIRRRIDTGKEEDGNRVRVLGSDHEDDSKDSRFRYKIGKEISLFSSRVVARVLGPIAKFKSEEDGEVDSGNYEDKNRGSIVLQLTIKSNDGGNSARILMGDDTEVAVWEQMEKKFAGSDLKYDVLLAPHHCSWKSLSRGHAEDKDSTIVIDAKKALSHKNAGAYIVISALSLENESNKKRKIGRERAFEEYKSIVNALHVLWTDDVPKGKKCPQPIEFEVSNIGGVIRKSILADNHSSSANAATVGTTYPHGV